MKKIFKKIYQLIPFRKQIFRLVKFFWVPPPAIYKHLHFKGKINVQTGRGRMFAMYHYGNEIENSVFWEGLYGWEKISMKYWTHLCRSANVILDIGANTGLYALTAKSVNPGATVYAFEPLRQMFTKLAYNVALNPFTIHCVEKAVSDKNGRAILYETGKENVAAATLNAELRQYGKLDRETEVECITLDAFVEENHLEKVDLVKIDVETHEPQVLRGYLKHLFLHRPDFLLEVLCEDAGEQLTRLFEGRGYLYYNVNDKEGKMKQTERIGKSDYFNYLILTEATARKLELI